MRVFSNGALPSSSGSQLKAVTEAWVVNSEKPSVSVWDSMEGMFTGVFQSVQEMMGVVICACRAVVRSE